MGSTTIRTEPAEKSLHRASVALVSYPCAARLVSTRGETMDANTKPMCVEVRPAESLTAYAQGKEETAMKNEANKPILPFALRDTEIPQDEVAVPLRVARDRDAGAAGYKRTPRRVPTAETAVAAQK